jgi:hypothetical protein
MEESKKAIEERQYFGTHYMHSPRTSRDKNFRISASRVKIIGVIRSGYRFFMRGDIRDTADYFESMEFMEKVKGTTYTREDQAGIFREHSIEVAGSTVESILGLGMVYEDFKYEELEDMPEIVKFMEEGLMARNMERRSARRYLSDYYQTGMEEWKWDEYDEIWGFAMVPDNHPNLTGDLEALRQRQAGIPAQLEEDELPGFHARMRRRGETRDSSMRGETL